MSIINPYRFAAAADEPSIAISLLSPSVAYADGSTYTDVEDDWGEVDVDTEKTVVLKIENTGTADLTITSADAVNVLNSESLSLTPTSSTISASSSTNADLVFTATGTACWMQIQVESNAPGTLATYVVDFSATATAGFPNTKSALFDGTNDFVEVDDSTSWNFGYGDFSISMWVYRPSSEADGIMNCFRASNGLEEYGWSIWTYSNELIFSTGDDFTTFNSGTDLPSDEWFHLACVREGGGDSFTAGMTTCYVNGSEWGTSQSELAAYNIGGGSTYAINFGRSPHGSWYFNGYIDECLITNTALSSSDVTDIRNSGTPKDESGRTGAVAYWRFEDDWTDSVGSNDGTNDGASFSTITP